MAKSRDVTKRLKISKAQKNMFAAVAGAALILGVSLVFSVYFLRHIRFNGTVISEKDKAIQGYSDAIRDIGVCRAPSGKIYNNTELERCVPDEVDLNSIPNTLRYNVIVNASQNKALESVGRSGLAICYDTATNTQRTFDWMYERYNLATTDADREYYLEMISMCSALRVIPDALPSSANPLALGASLNKIFQISSYEPDGITPGGEIESDLPGIGAIGVSLQVESNNAATTMNVLNNIEKSIREIKIRTARIEYRGGGLRLNASAMAYYTAPAELTESIEVVRGDGKILRDTTEGEQ
ncbi:hypothetical protein IKE71_02970 [Candidatus Saccharibacteria bacterium]|nr:hypothetical protein [Candidatus Saccharibacteria bacterium]